MDKKALGARIRRLRQERDEPLTQEKLAILMGVDQKSISKWETGTARPDICRLSLLAEVLDTTVDELLTPGELAPVATQ